MMSGALKKITAGFCLITVFTISLFWYHTRNDMRLIPEHLLAVTENLTKPQLTDRYGDALTVTYQNRWNTSDYLASHEIPDKLKQIFILSEDKRFFDHGGVDWYARFHALWQNITAGESVRGASTISEQVVRMIHPRPRTVWSRWLEGFEAQELETKNSKGGILEFYLNQVPYASNRRGIGQASLFYFNRAVDTLSLKEMLALAVLVRAPSYYDLYRNPGTIDSALNRFSLTLYRNNFISEIEYQKTRSERLDLESPKLMINAEHFAGAVYQELPGLLQQNRKRIKTTLDGPLQVNASKILQHSLGRLKKNNVINGACLVSDHTTGEILVWAVATGDDDPASGRTINSVLVKRQPGSSMKPFLYCLALEKGWTAATLIDDNSLINPVGRGLHTYHNYSRLHYGNVTVRQALGNSLNIPAIKAIRFTGVDDYLKLLREMGVESLIRHSDFYGDGLALGNGEVTLFELVQAYNVLANRGRFQPLYFTEESSEKREISGVISKESTSIIANILSDPDARDLEFGSGSILNFPVQTAVKTGTSNDYRDAWAVGFNHRYSAGVWLGNLDGRAMDGITGSTGPAMILRSIFADLNKRGDSKPLYISPELVQKDICVDPSFKGPDCITITELFVPGTEPMQQVKKIKRERIGFLKPVNGLEMAMDPRIPDEDEAFEFVVSGVGKEDRITWKIDGKTVGETRGGTYMWPLQRGRHIVEISIAKKGDGKRISDEVTFVVK